MKIIVLRAHLKEGLVVVERALGEGASLPILKNVLLEARGEDITLTATNLEIALRYSVPGKVLEGGSLTTPLGLLSNIVGNLTSERINLEQKQQALLIKTENYEGSINGMPAEDFPIIPKISNQTEKISMTGSVFRGALGPVAGAAQITDLRPELSSVLWDYSIDNIRLVATDTYRLAEKTVTGGQYQGGYPQPLRKLIPLRTIQELLRTIKDTDEVELLPDQSQLLVRTKNFECITRFVEGVFPDYQTIIPSAFTAEVTLKKQELIDALKLVSVLGGRNNEVRVEPEKTLNGIKLSSGDTVAGENQYLLPVKLTNGFNRVTFNARYLLDGLRSLIGEDVFWGINEDKPALLKNPKDPSFFYIIAPILTS